MRVRIVFKEGDWTPYGVQVKSWRTLWLWECKSSYMTLSDAEEAGMQEFTLWDPPQVVKELKP